MLTANKYENPAPISRVKVYGDRVASVAVNCRHCDDPACVKACITGAMHKDKKTGIVSVDPDKCIGCMTCLAVCPIGCIQPGNIAYKCDLCGGEEPACVKGCPNRALVWVEAGGAAKVKICDHRCLCRRVVYKFLNAKKVMLNVSFCESSELMMEEMNEIHEFMSKFREGVEVIWGVAMDNTLEGKVKITVLATGFGMEDVPGMDSVLEKRSQEEEERQLQLEEEKEKNKERIRKAYGESASGIGSKNIRKRRHIYIFNPEDLDNADIISMVESSPTYLRDKSTLSTIKTKAATEGQLATEEAQGGEVDKRFNLSSDDEAAALRILTLGRMERILALADSSIGKFAVNLNPDGRVYIAVHSGRGFFDIGKGYENPAQLRQRFAHELRWFTDEYFE